MRKYISISAFFFEAIISQTIFFLFNFPQSRYKWLPILAAKSSNFFGGRSWSRRLSIEVGEKRKKERGKREWKRGSGSKVGRAKGRGRGVVPVSQDAFLRVRGFDACGLLIATRLDALSRVHTSWDTCWTGEWMDRRVTKIGSRIRQGTGYYVKSNDAE